MLFSLALKMLANEEEAKDVVQETFIRVWKGIRNYDSEKSFATWLYTIGSRLCLDHLKTMKPIVSQPDDISVLKHYATEDDSQQILENSEWIAIIRMLAEGLSEKQRLVFTLCQLEGISTQEAEKITGQNAQQLKSNLYVARQTIRKRLKELGYE
jgi:RNA polymerase sigma-70 factor (ECF subfamily)